MSELYNIIESLCKNNDIDVTALCGNAGIPIAALSELKAGRTRRLSTPTLTKIAEYFDVSVDYLLGKEQQKRPPLRTVYLKLKSKLLNMFLLYPMRIFRAPFIKSTKTEAGERTIPLLTKLEAVLPKGKGFVFGTEDKPPTLCTFRRHWEAFCNEADITVTPHQLRHLFATVLYESGIDEKLAQEILGHSSIRMTKDLYTHIRTSKLDEAREKINSFSL